MKTNAFLLGFLLTLGVQLFPARADEQPTAFEKALYEKARFRVVSKLSDDDFACYCVTMNIGGDTLLKFHDQILAKQFELAKLQSEGFTDENPQVMAANAELKDLRSQFTVKLIEARKGLEVESKIAEQTLSDLSQYQK